jgi:hypothetical protein
MNKKEKGIRTFFFGKRRQVYRIHSPFVFKASLGSGANKEEEEKNTPSSYIKACDFTHILHTNTLTCVERSSAKGRHIAIQRYEKYKDSKLDGDDLYGLFQFKNNCWFNSLLMCLFFSDGMRRIMNIYRQEWITQNTKQSTKRTLLSMFTYLMEIPHYHKGILGKIDTNMILTMLHTYDRDMFEHPGYDGGSGILYCKKLLEFLGVTESYIEVRLIHDHVHKRIYVEKNGTPYERISYDTMKHMTTYIENIVRKSSRNPEIVVVFIDIAESYTLPDELCGLTLDSVYLSNFQSMYRHAIAGITCDNVRYIYDGQRALIERTLKPFDWLGKNNVTFSQSYDKKKMIQYKFSRSTRVGFFVKKE